MEWVWYDYFDQYFSFIISKLREAIRFKVEQRMEGARKDRHVTQNTMPHLVAQ